MPSFGKRAAKRVVAKELKYVTLFIEDRGCIDLSKMNKIQELNTGKAKKHFNRDLTMT